MSAPTWSRLRRPVVLACAVVDAALVAWLWRVLLVPHWSAPLPVAVLVVPAVVLAWFWERVQPAPRVETSHDAVEYVMRPVAYTLTLAVVVAGAAVVRGVVA